MLNMVVFSRIDSALYWCNHGDSIDLSLRRRGLLLRLDERIKNGKGAVVEIKKRKWRTTED